MKHSLWKSFLIMKLLPKLAKYLTLSSHGGGGGDFVYMALAGYEDDGHKISAKGQKNGKPSSPLYAAIFAKVFTCVDELCDIFCNLSQG